MDLQRIVLWSALILTTAKFVSSNDKYKQQTAVEGSSYKMKCVDADTYPSRPYIIWTVNGKPPRGPKYKFLTDGLVIRNVTAEDALVNYTCTLLDRVSLSPIQSETLKLKTHQRSGKLLENQAVVSKTGRLKIWGVVNQSKTLHCVMYSRPSPTFQWRNEEITGDEITNTPDLYTIEEADGISNLTIFIRNDSMFAEYVCQGSNNLGSSAQHFLLVKGYKPIAPFIFPVFIGKDRVTFKVKSHMDKGANNAMEVLPILNYVVQLKTGNLNDAGSSDTDLVHTIWISLPEADQGHGGLPFIFNHGGGTLEVKQLKENTTYLVRSAVGNAAALSDFSPAVRVTTEASLVNVSPKSDYKDLQSNTDSLHGGTKDRSEYGRATEEIKVKSKLGMTTDETINSTCTNPRFRKTVIITTISTTLIEDNTGTGIGNSSLLIKKRVEEDTTINRENLCAL
ncbi:unnamed protein product [Orchesella dallaii]|uniref:Ig-like domain-containing protein n=1 Tax=Orchesella dallaii TaxID=48710 RepID=A0ABP1Q9G9_9HEXA